MPLDEFQKGIAAALSANRNTGSPFAGGAVIQRHGFRLSNDQDIFTGWDLEDIAERDIATLEGAGYTVSRGRVREGFRECLVSKPATGRTVLQWTHGLSREFYRPVADELFGFRLHFADLAVNKALAAGNRMVVRDFVDLWMLDRHVIPLWRIVCAAPGKDPDFSPHSLLEEISRNWHFARAREEESYDATFDISTEEMGAGLRAGIREARQVLDRLPEGRYGRLQVTSEGLAAVSRDDAPGGRWIAPQPGGCMPSFDGIDREMIAGLIAEYGREGSRYTQDGGDGFTGGA